MGRSGRGEQNIMFEQRSCVPKESIHQPLKASLMDRMGIRMVSMKEKVHAYEEVAFRLENQNGVPCNSKYITESFLRTIGGVSDALNPDTIQVLPNGIFVACMKGVQGITLVNPPQSRTEEKPPKKTRAKKPPVMTVEGHEAPKTERKPRAKKPPVAAEASSGPVVETKVVRKPRAKKQTETAS